jgi:sugar phosphate isomerase/epimerase
MGAPSRRRFLGFAGAVGLAGLGASRAVAIGDEKNKSCKFRLGIVTYNIAASWDLGTILRVCQGVGLSPVELRTTHKHDVEPALSRSARKDVRKRFADAGIDIWGCGTICEFQSPDPAVVAKNIEQCKAFVQLAADIGGRGVKVRPNGLPTNVPVEKTLEQIGQALGTCGKAAADAGIEIWLEVHGKGTSHPPHIRTIMQHCGHPSVGLTWNSNATDVKNGSVSEYFRMLWPWIRSCHISELHSGYPYRELFRLFREAGYDRVTLAEIEGMPDVRSGERLMRYYKALWAELSRD